MLNNCSILILQLHHLQILDKNEWYRFLKFGYTCIFQKIILIKYSKINVNTYFGMPEINETSFWLKYILESMIKILILIDISVPRFYDYVGDISLIFLNN